MGRLTGERRAFAAAVLAFYAFLFLLLALLQPGWGAAFTAMALVYGAGFFALVAGYFWARWYAIGLGMSGLITAVFSMFQLGSMHPILLFYGATHAGLSLLLWGGVMSLGFDGRKEWRERFHLDENATHKLGKSVIRLGISLPYIVLYALAPKEGAAEALFAALAGGLVLTGVVAMFRMRTWGVAALVGGVVAMGASLITAPFELAPFGNGYAVNVTAAGMAAMLLIAAALAPLARPIVRYLRA